MNAYRSGMSRAQRTKSSHEPMCRVHQKMVTSTVTVKAICTSTIVTGMPKAMVTCLLTIIIDAEHAMKSRQDRSAFVA